MDGCNRQTQLHINDVKVVFVRQSLTPFNSIVVFFRLFSLANGFVSLNLTFLNCFADKFARFSDLSAETTTVRDEPVRQRPQDRRK